MRTWAKGTSRAAVLTAGFVALGVSAIPANAYADITDGGGSVLGGNQVNAPVSAPADVSGNAAALLGDSYAASRGGAKARPHGGGAQRTSGEHGVASGNQVNAPVSVPVNACGNAVAAPGHADAGCTGGAKVKGGGKNGQSTDGTGGVLGGNQVNAPISIPVNVCGNAVSVTGLAAAGCEGGSAVKNGPGRPGHGGPGYTPHHRTTGTTVPSTEPVPLPEPDNPLKDADLKPLTDVKGPVSLLDAQTGRRAADGVPATTGLLKDGGLPQVKELPEVEAPLEGVDLVKAASGGDVSVLDAQASPGPGDRRAATPRVLADGGLPQADGVLGKGEVGGALKAVPDAVSGGDGTVALLDSPVLPHMDDRRAARGVPGAAGLLKDGALPTIGGVPTVNGLSGGLPKAPATEWADRLDGRRVPSAGGVPQVGGVAAKPAVGAPPGAVVGGVSRTVLAFEPVAAKEPIKDEDGAMWTLAVSGALAALAGAMALTRRVRVTRR